MLKTKHLTKKYGERFALVGLSLDIEPGEIFALLGQNGAGKSTTINCFLGFVKPTSGQVYVNGLSVVDHALETKKYLAYIPENVMLYSNLTGVENLEFFSALAGFNYTKKELGKMLFKVGLQISANDQWVSTYSKGMRQKVGIAIAIAKNAKALLLDEPTSGLDPKASNEFSNILNELAKNDTAILMATHDIFRAKEIAGRIGIMKEGSLVSEIKSSDITTNELEKVYLQTV
ncbi:MAG: ABC transporter ATP-binding protein [Alphaproteobacteria bacterium]|nr:ABC transporter ATP-binding protein [Alphaproteobacteria bacterium]